MKFFEDKRLGDGERADSIGLPEKEKSRSRRGRYKLLQGFW